MSDFRHINKSTRRQVLAAGLALPTLGIPGLGYCSSGASRQLAFYHTHTGETLNVVYREGADYLPDALGNIDRFLRDFRTGEAHPIDPLLLDQLHDIRSALGTTARVEIISGYRSPKTNNMLRGRSNGVAKRSLHMQGRALDVRLTDVPTKDLRAAAFELQSGGVGYYPKSGFIHVDTGRFRTW